MKDRKKILALVLLLVIGFATVSTTLVLNGTIGISKNNGDFNIIFTGAKLDGKIRNDFIDSETKKTINFVTEKLTKINETTTLEYDVANTSRIYDGEVSISCNIVDDASNTTTSEYIEMEYTPTSMTVLAGETKRGSITAKLIKGSTENQSIKIKCTLNANATEKEELGEEYIPMVSFPEGYDLMDTNKNGEADIGEEIIVGTENFYVISNTNTEINALAKYNLNVGENKNPSVTEGIQHKTVRGWLYRETMYGNVAFSNDKGWAYENNETIDIKSYDGPVKTALYGENGYEKYVQSTIPNSSLRLITYEELLGLGCQPEYTTCSRNAPAWLFNTTYWSGSAGHSYDNRVWRINSNGGFNDDNPYSNTYYCGVRPVVTIPKILPEGYQLINDVDKNFVADTGDEIAIGTERFYVISHTDNVINALAKYNLNVGNYKNPDAPEGIQHETVRGNPPTRFGTVAFANPPIPSTPSGNQAIDVKQYDGPVKDALYGTNGYEKYLQRTIPNSSVRLINKSELEELGCSGSCSGAASWVYSASYWIQYINTNAYGSSVYRVGAGSDISSGDYKYDGSYGVRPVVTIPLNNN